MGEKKGFFIRLVSGLTKTRKNIASGLDSIFHGFSKIDDDFYEELEEILIMGDLGVDTTMNIIEDLQERVKEEHIKEPAECRQLLIDIIKKQMEVDETAYEYENRTSVVLVIGVNGVGKTTTIGKLAAQLKSQNKKVIMAAADTFRAAAIEHLQSGLTELVLTLLHSRKVLIRQQLFMMPARQQSQDMQMFFYAILPDVFIIRRTL